MKRIILVGGRHFNVPRQLKLYFEIARHYESDEVVRGTAPAADLIIVIRNWVSHGQVAGLRLRKSSIPVVWVSKGWNAMRDELVRRGLIVPTESVETVPDEPELAETESEGEPEPAVDPFETMTDEELEKLTAPDPKLEDQVKNTLWGEHSRRFAERWTVEAGIALTELVTFALRHQEGMINAKCVIDELHVKDFGTASRMAIGLNRTLSSYKSKTDPNYVPRETKPVGTKSIKVQAEPIIPAETTGMLLNCQKKIDERNALLKERELIDQRLAAVDKEIELMKPVLDAMQALQRATRAVKDKIGAKAG